MRKYLLVLLPLLVALASCNVGNRKMAVQEQDSVKKFILQEVWRTDSVLRTPESVIYDKKRDILYVSNVNMEPRQKDGNGFISRLDKSGNITDLHWIDGLSGPKGMAIVGDTLFAADIDEIVAMDINKASIIRKIPVNGARMLNDIASDSDGNLYISDTDANKIHRYSTGKLQEWMAQGLLGPNGLLVMGDTLFLAAQGSNNFAAINIPDLTMKVVADSLQHGDGIAYTGIPGYLLVTNWEGEIFMINPDFSKTMLLNTKQQQTNTADIEFLQKEKLLLVPTFFKNCVIAFSLNEEKP